MERAVEKVLSGKTGENPSVPRYETLVLGITWPREVLYERIGIRLDRRLEMGMIDEVRNLRTQGATDEFLYKLGLEYRYILMYLRGEFDSFSAFHDKLFMEIRHLAKEQMTWFRKRKDIRWIDMYKDPVKEAGDIKATWPDELILRTSLDELEAVMEDNDITKTALIIVGNALGDDYELSRLYDKSFSTGFRKVSL